MTKIITPLLLMLFFGFSTLAQNVRIYGAVTEKSSNTLVNGATVHYYLENDSSKNNTTITNNKGEFEFLNTPSGTIHLKITSIGYKIIEKTITITEQAEQNTGIVMLEKGSKELENVTVVSKGPAIVQKDDTSQYNAKQYQVNPDATTEDLVKKMPGIAIDNKGTITAHGEQVKKVTVDGKDFFGDDATSALKNIPAVAVDKIQVFDKMSDQSQMTGIDDGNSQKSINIITKAGINNSQFGRVFAGVGTKNTYSAGGNMSFFNKDRRISLVGNFNNINQQNFGSQDFLGLTGSKPSTDNNRFRGPGAPSESFSIDLTSGISITNAIGINYSDKLGKRATIAGSYFFNETRNNNQSVTNTKIFDGNLNNYKRGGAFSDNFNHRINARIEYKIDTNNMLFVIPNISFQSNKSTSAGTALSYINIDDSLSNSNALTEKNKDGYNIKNNLLFRHSFKKKNRIFTMGFNTAFTKNNGATDINADYKFFDLTGNPPSDSLQQQYIDNKSNGSTIGGSLTYNEPVGKKGRGQFQFEYNPSVQTNNADQKTFGYDGQSYSKYDSTLSNQFENKIITQNGGVTYRFNRSKDEQLGININYQQAQFSSERITPNSILLKRTFSNFMPYAYWRKKINKYANIRAFYRANVNFPTITQLQDVYNLSNPLNISIGNKELKQSLTQYTGSRFSYTNTKTNKSIFANFFIQKSDNNISNATYIAANDSTLENGIILKQGSQLSKPLNLDGYLMFRSSFTYSLPVKWIKSTVNLTSSMVYTKMPGMINSILTSTNTYLYNLGLGFVSNINEYVDYNITYNANINKAQTVGGTLSNNNYVNHNINVAFNLLSKSGWFVQNDFNHQIFKGLSAGYDRNFTLWNAAVGKKFFKNKTGEIKLSVFDILKQNQSVSRTVTNTYLEDSRSEVLQQYYMLTFSYNLKNFGKPAKSEAKDDFIPKVGYPSSY